MDLLIMIKKSTMITLKLMITMDTAFRLENGSRDKIISTAIPQKRLSNNGKVVL